MKRILILVLSLLVLLVSFSHKSLGQQTTNGTILSEDGVKEIFTEAVKSELGISYPIFKAYEYNDKDGKHYLVLTEKKYKQDGDKSLNDSIKGFNINSINGKLQIAWTMSDFLLKEGNEVSEEYSIWFWTKFVELKDLDKDGLIEPIVVYGTSGMNGISDGRIKILVYYKGIKYAIRHQNGVHDYDRNTQVDKKFYELPQSIQNEITIIMGKITEKTSAIFPAGWEEAMKNKKVKFKEDYSEGN